MHQEINLTNGTHTDTNWDGPLFNSSITTGYSIDYSGTNCLDTINITGLETYYDATYENDTNHLIRWL